MGRRTWVGAVVALAIVAGCSTSDPEAAPVTTPGAVTLAQVQVIGTHDSYHQELTEPEQAAFDELARGVDTYGRSLAYSHAPLADQLEDQGVRSLELDLYPDPDGGLYAEPAVRRALGSGPLDDPAWSQPGIKVLHVVDLDPTTSCVLFTTCLDQIRTWSDAHPDHLPLFVLLEPRQSDARAVAAGGVEAPPWDAARLDDLDDEIRATLEPTDLITPDDVREEGRTLERSVLDGRWPPLDASRGEVVFLLVADDGGVRARYAAGHPGLAGRVLFTDGEPGQPDTAFVRRDDPLAPGVADEIRRLVAAGYLVRTRADEPLVQARSGDRSRLDAAVASGAQIVSTDFPAPGLATRYGSDYVATLPGGTTWRCNPVNAAPGCRDADLDPGR